MNWITVTGREDANLESELKQSSERVLAAGELSAKQLKHVSNLKASVVDGELQVNDVVLEKLRTLCMSWDIDIKPREIASHRKFIGPVIVAFKKLLYPIIRALLFNTIQAQRHFNGTAISLLAEIANNKPNQKKN